jgi:hypothetical protein
MEHSETVKVYVRGDDFEVIVQHDQSGSAYGFLLSKEVYEKLRLHFLGEGLIESGCEHNWQNVFSDSTLIGNHCTRCQEFRPQINPID